MTKFESENRNEHFVQSPQLPINDACVNEDGSDTEANARNGSSLVVMSACTLTEHDPVTDVAIVSKKQACPHGYKLIDTTVGGLPVDLADKKLLAKVHRFFVLTREFPLPTGNFVVQDLQLFSEGSPVPMGYEILSHTRNDGLLSLKKVNFCLKRAYREHVVSCVCDIMFVSRQRKETLPPRYVGIGEVNGLTVAVEFGGIPGALQIPPPIGQSPVLCQKSVPASHSSQTHEETTEVVNETEYSIFKPYFYHGVPPRPAEDIAKAEEIKKKQQQDDDKTTAACPVPEGLDLFSRFQDMMAHPGSLPETHSDEHEGESEGKHNRRDSYSSQRIYQSMRPISVVPLTALLEIQFKVNPTLEVSSSIVDLLSSSALDLLYVEHAEEVEEKFMYSFAVERETLFMETTDAKAVDTKPSAPVDGACIQIEGHSIALPLTEHRARTQSPQHKRRSKSRLKTPKKDKHQASEKLKETEKL